MEHLLPTHKAHDAQEWAAADLRLGISGNSFL